MKRLIISSNTYSWIPYCAGMLMSEEANNVLYIVNKDHRKMLNCKYLCKDALFVQRQHDIMNIAKSTNISEVHFYSNDNIESLKIQIQLSIALGDVDEIYYPDWDILNDIIGNLSEKMSINSFSYNPKIYGYTLSKQVILEKGVYSRKLQLSKKMIGINSKKEIKNLYKPIERFY